MTFKVSKAKLVAAIEAKRAEVVSAHTSALLKHSSEFADFKRAMTLELSTLLANVKSAKKIGDITKRLKYGTRLEFDKIPEVDDAPNVAKYDRALAQLALCADDFVTLSDKSDSPYMSLIS